MLRTLPSVADRALRRNCIHVDLNVIFFMLLASLNVFWNPSGRVGLSKNQTLVATRLPCVVRGCSNMPHLRLFMFDGYDQTLWWKFITWSKTETRLM
jgi:hypothetical protein